MVEPKKGTTHLKQKMHLVKWQKVTATIEFGGLGIQRLGIKNNALIVSLSCRLFKSPTQLWAATPLHKYNKHALTSWGHSHTWKNILLGWAHCQLGLQWNIGTNSLLKYWTDAWLAPAITMRSLISGHLPFNHQNTTIANYMTINVWDWDKCPFDVPTTIKMLV